MAVMQLGSFKALSLDRFPNLFYHPIWETFQTSINAMVALFFFVNDNMKSPNCTNICSLVLIYHFVALVGLHAFNKAFPAKQCWRIVCNPNALWVLFGGGANSPNPGAFLKTQMARFGAGKRFAVEFGAVENHCRVC
ncbi:hypothetical protein GBA52_003760 [Prunus armeniaca]|nr:hypothetical protein GBA52_003760 [Prunus armeniaca]